MRFGHPFALLSVLALAGASLAGPPAWSPPTAPSPLRQIWSFDTKG